MVEVKVCYGKPSILNGYIDSPLKTAVLQVTDMQDLCAKVHAAFGPAQASYDVTVKLASVLDKRDVALVLCFSKKSNRYYHLLGDATNVFGY